MSQAIARLRLMETKGQRIKLQAVAGNYLDLLSLISMYALNSLLALVTC